MVDDMKILSEMPTGLGGKWVLVDYGNDFYAYGVEKDLYSFLGFPVKQCGSKEEVIEHCKSIAELCKKNIQKFNKNLKKDKTDGWKLLIEQEQKKLDMLTKFISILST